MKIFLYEWSCAEPMDPTPSNASLAREGKAMLRCIAEDIIAMGHSIGTMSWNRPDLPNGPIDHWITDPNDVSNQFQNLADTCQTAIIIAPEMNDILIHRLEWLAETNCSNAGCSIEAVRLTGDKFALWQFWKSNKVPAITTWTSPLDVCGNSAFVIKPRHGAGSCNTEVILEPGQIDLACQRLEKAGSGPLVIQPKHEGMAISIAVLVSQQQVPHSFLPACQQLIDSTHNTLKYKGGSGPLNHHLHLRAEQLARRCLQGIHGLAGWVGIDMILGNTADGSKDVVVEINPRLTTSYIGLRRIIGFNPIRMWLEPGHQPDSNTPPTDTNQVTWSADGEVQITPGDS